QIPDFESGASTNSATLAHPNGDPIDKAMRANCLGKGAVCPRPPLLARQQGPGPDPNSLISIDVISCGQELGATGDKGLSSRTTVLKPLGAFWVMSDDQKKSKHFRRTDIRSQVTPLEIKGLLTNANTQGHTPLIIWDISDQGMRLWVTNKLKA